MVRRYLPFTPPSPDLFIWVKQHIKIWNKKQETSEIGNIHGNVSELVRHCSNKVLHIIQNHHCSPHRHQPQLQRRTRRYRRRSNILWRTQWWSPMLAITPKERSHQGGHRGHQNPSNFQGSSCNNPNPFPIISFFNDSLHGQCLLAVV